MFDERVALETILYVVTHSRPPVELYTVVKTIYFADLLHLQRYGRFMFGDSYAALKDGPVPSITYDLLKPAIDADQFDQFDVRSILKKGNGRYELRALREPDMDYLSGSEVECLDDAITIANSLPTFGAKRELSHGPAWKRAWALAQKTGKGSYPIDIRWFVDQISETAGPEWARSVTEYIEEYAD